MKINPRSKYQSYRQQDSKTVLQGPCLPVCSGTEARRNATKCFLCVTESRGAWATQNRPRDTNGCDQHNDRSGLASATNAYRVDSTAATVTVMAWKGHGVQVAMEVDFEALRIYSSAGPAERGEERFAELPAPWPNPCFGDVECESLA